MFTLLLIDGPYPSGKEFNIPSEIDFRPRKKDSNL